MKMALCALALLPLGAWAEVDFGTEATVSTTTTWTFGDLKTGETYKSVTNNLILATESSTTTDFYLRGSDARNFTVSSCTSKNLTFADGTEVSTGTAYLKANGNYNTSNSSAPEATTKAGDDCTVCVPSFAFNASVAGTLYLKVRYESTYDAPDFRIWFTNGTSSEYVGYTVRSNSNNDIYDEIAYTSKEAGSFFVTCTKNGAFGIYAARFVPATVTRPEISAETEFTVNNLSLIGAANTVYAGDGLYIRGYAANANVGASNRTISISSLDTPQNITLGDKNISVSKIAVSNANLQIPDNNIKHASSYVGTNAGTPMLAFNTSAPGTVYAAIEPVADGSGTARVYFSDGADAPSNVSSTTVTMNNAGTIYTVSGSSDKSGSFFVAGTVPCKIYAIRFVPKTYTLTVNAENGNVARSPEKDAYDYNDEVTLTATPAEGYKFVNWSTGETTTSITVTMTENKTITANFAAYQATVSVGSTGYATFANTTGSTLAVPEHLTAYGVSGFSSTGVTFQEYNVIPTGVGVILQAEDGYESESYGFDATETASTYSGSNFLVPVTEAKTVPATEYRNSIINYIFANKSNGVGFYKSSGSGTIAAGKAYLSIPNPAQETRTWTFYGVNTDDTWGDGTSGTDLYNLEYERENTGSWWELDAETNSRYRYKTKQALNNEELYANGYKIARTEGLKFIATSGRLSLENREAKKQAVFFRGDDVQLIIPGLLKGSTVVVAARTSDGKTGHMECSGESSDVTRSSSIEENGESANTFTIVKTASEYRFSFVKDKSTGSLNIWSVTVTPPASFVTSAHEFLGFEGTDENEEEEVNSIKDVKMTTAVNDDTWYTLQGVKVAHPAKGIYINNGKKVVIK